MEMVVVVMEEEEGENANTDPELVERYSVRGAGATYTLQLQDERRRLALIEDLYRTAALPRGRDGRHSLPPHGQDPLAPRGRLGRPAGVGRVTPSQRLPPD